MKFVKLHMPGIQGTSHKEHNEWRLVLSTYEDVLYFAQHENDLVSRAFMQLERTSDGLFDAAHARDKRVGALGAMLNVAYHRLEEGQTFYPVLEASKLVQRKLKAFVVMIERGSEVSINYAGGYCDHDGYMTIWNATEVESIETQNVNFPQVA